MASPVSDSYSVASGAGIYGGRFSLKEASVNAVLVGDSLTAHSYGELHNFTWLNGLAGAPLKVIKNLGIPNQKVSDILARIDNTSDNWGMSDIPNLGWAILRAGTNDTRGGAFLSEGVKASYTSLITKMLTYASRVIVMAVPPCGPPPGGVGVNGYNDWLSDFCARTPNTHFIDDCGGVNDGTGHWTDGYSPGDGIHISTKGAQRMGADGAIAFAALMAPHKYPDPISTSVYDVYPNTNQWIVNPTMVGSGSVPDSWTVGGHGSGHVVSGSTVLADAGDANQTPWVRVTPTELSITQGGYMQVTASMAGRPITDVDPAQLEIVVELRFNNFEASRFKSMYGWVYGTGNEKLVTIKLQLGDANLNGRVVARSAEVRPYTNVASPGAYLLLTFPAVAAYIGSVGSFDVRCGTVRG